MAPSKKKKAKTKTSNASAPKTAKKTKTTATKETTSAKASSSKKAAPQKAAPKKKAARPPGAAKAKGAKTKASAAKSSLKKVAKTIAAVLAPAVLTTLAVKSAGGKKSKAESGTDYTSVLTPLDDRILVRAETMTEKTADGIIIPGTVEERPQRGEVLAVGRGRRNKKGNVRPLELSVGETVMFAESAGSKVTLAGAELLILREDEVLGVVG